MALVTRYFGVSGAGAADGTSYANRAPLYTAGNWSSIITAFNFTSDTLLCLIAPGNYTCSQSLTSAIFSSTVPTNNEFSLNLSACDSSGVPWVCPTDWSSASIPTWQNDLPFIDHTANSAWVNLIGLNLYGMNVRRSNALLAANSRPFQSASSMQWCYGEVTASSTAVSVFNPQGTTPLINCVGVCSGTAFDNVFIFSSTTAVENCKAIGNPAASSGNRAGFNVASAISMTFSYCTASGVFSGFQYTGAVGGRFATNRCTVKSNGYGMYAPSANTSGLSQGVHDSFIVAATEGVTTPIVLAQGIRNNRIRSATPLVIPASQIAYGNITTAGSDADEFVDAANHDLRIKNTSTYWGKGLGAGDEPASGGGNIIVIED